jgi:hypothetical protein
LRGSVGVGVGRMSDAFWLGVGVGLGVACTLVNSKVTLLK